MFSTGPIYVIPCDFQYGSWADCAEARDWNEIAERNMSIKIKRRKKWMATRETSGYEFIYHIHIYMYIFWRRHLLDKPRESLRYLSPWPQYNAFVVRSPGARAPRLPHQARCPKIARVSRKYSNKRARALFSISFFPLLSHSLFYFIYTSTACTWDPCFLLLAIHERESHLVQKRRKKNWSKRRGSNICVEENRNFEQEI